VPEVPDRSHEDSPQVDESGSNLSNGKFATAFASWRGKLIDLSKRNRALNWRPLKVGSVSIVDEKPVQVYRALVGDEGSFTFAAAAETGAANKSASLRAVPPHATSAASEQDSLDFDDEAIAQEFAPYGTDAPADRHVDSILQTNLPPERLDTSLRRLAEVQRSNLDEQGVNTLYLALGFLHYKEASQAEKWLKAPLVMVPVELKRQSARVGFELAATDDDAVLNPSLVEYLRRMHEISDFPVLPEPSDESASVDLVPLLQHFSTEIAAPRNWKVTEEIALGHFAFQKLVIFRDLEANQERFAAHHLVRRIVLNEAEPVSGLPPDVAKLDLDREYPPEKTAQVLDADSSQMRALIAVAKGHDLVIHGPPGTGKSQTITNLIADALHRGKSVLFVAEKMAALEVVHHRLVEAHLGEFCLELHSTKSRKANVIEDLRRALESHAAPGSGVPSSEPTLVKTRSNLNAYVEHLHTPIGSLNCTPFEAIGKFAQAHSAARFEFKDDITTLNSDTMADLCDRLNALEVLLKHCAPVSSNGWRDSDLQSWSERIALNVERQVQSTISMVMKVVREAGEQARLLGLAEPTTLAQASGLATVGAHIAGSPGIPGEILRDSAWLERPKEVMELLGLGRRHRKFGARLNGRYTAEVLQSPESIAQDDVHYVDRKRSGTFGFLAVLDPKYRSICKRWRQLLAAGARAHPLEQASDFKRLPGWIRDGQTIESYTSAANWCGSLWRGVRSDWEALEQRSSWIERFHSLMKSHGPFGSAAFDAAEQGGGSDELPITLATTVRQLDAQLKVLAEEVHWPIDYFDGISIPSLLLRLQQLEADLARGAVWTKAVATVRALRTSPAAEIAEAGLAGTIPAQDVSRAFRRAVYGTWLEKLLPTIPSLADFSTAVQEEMRLLFQKSDRELLAANQATVASKLRETGSARFQSSPTAQRQFLHKEMAKLKRHRPLRVTLRQAGDAVAALKPCFMMSPLSVSQLLAGDIQFDLVVFDEASQLPTEDAIAAICRGKQLVVVGDPKQLPPTNFFAVQSGAVQPLADENGDTVLEETESVLEQFQGSGLYEAHLEWHYRSAHESLIQFSNAHFYGNRLNVFPSAAVDSPERGVQFEFVEEGCYAGAGVNPPEAVRVARAVIEHFRSSPRLSLGVGTFNLRQQLAIMDELERLRRDDPGLEALFDRAVAEPFFVKNLENIQGDERDVILLSITYGKNAEGKLHYNFGPLNRQEGWRRLNVLVSRARQCMRVFSSLHAGDINPNATASQGPALLRDFLRFAETGQSQLDAGAGGWADSPFEQEVGEVIHEMGYLVDRQVGVGPYRIDIGVRHRQQPGVYVAGVECDGAAYHSAPWARDRDRLRQQLLELRGWTIIRIWSTDWFKDRGGTVQRLKTTLAALLPEQDEESAA
jgi:very-short-patch-repair endonuclease